AGAAELARLVEAAADRPGPRPAAAPGSGDGTTDAAPSGDALEAHPAHARPSAPVARAEAPAAPHVRSAAATPVAQVAVQIVRGVQEGQSRISVQLDPPELGRVDVRLEVAHDGKVMAVVSADRQETLDLLQRDARGLERALQEAG